VERTVTRSLPLPETTAFDLAVPPLSDPASVARLIPLWRYVAFTAALFVVLSFWVHTRVAVQELREDLDKVGRAQREARVTNDRLRLELDARRRAIALEGAAVDLGLGERARVIRVGGSR
jgi:hypothetical protein